MPQAARVFNGNESGEAIMRDGKWSSQGDRNRTRDQRKAGDRYLRSPAESRGDPQQEAKDARRNARERAQLWKSIKAQH